MLHCIMLLLFTNKMLPKNISTDGEVISKINVAYFFLGHGVALLELLRVRETVGLLEQAVVHSPPIDVSVTL